MLKGKPYKKPKIRQVALVPKEAVLAGCKLNTGADTGAPTDCYKNAAKKCSDVST